MNQYILALDTSCAITAISLSSIKGGYIDHFIDNTMHNQSSVLMLEIDKMLKRHQVNYHDLKYIVAMIMIPLSFNKRKWQEP